MVARARSLSNMRVAKEDGRLSACMDGILVQQAFGQVIEFRFGIENFAGDPNASKQAPTSKAVKGHLRILDF